FDGDPDNDENDTTGKGDNGYWDIYTADAGLSNMDEVIRLQKPTTSAVSFTNTLDAIIYSNNDGKFTGSKPIANELVAAGLWAGGFDFDGGDSGAVIVSDDLPSGFSIRRDLSPPGNNSGADWSILSQTQGRANCPLPAADFTADLVSGCVPLSVCLTDSSAGEITKWTWDLDGDSSLDTTVRNPCYT
ncbi:MAG: hypothetical protein QME81_20440, partial [bacterium]|nr:hypothetical protein [bacterium]